MFQFCQDCAKKRGWFYFVILQVFLVVWHQIVVKKKKVVNEHISPQFSLM